MVIALTPAATHAIPTQEAQPTDTGLREETQTPTPVAQHEDTGVASTSRASVQTETQPSSSQASQPSSSQPSTPSDARVGLGLSFEETYSRTLAVVGDRNTGSWTADLKLVGTCLLCQSGYVLEEKDSKGANSERTMKAHSNGYCQRCNYIVYNQEKPGVGQLRNRSAAWVLSCRLCQHHVPVMLHQYDTCRATTNHLCSVCSSAPGSQKAADAENMYKKARINHTAFVEGGSKFVPQMQPGSLSNLIPAPSPRHNIPINPSPVANATAQAAAIAESRATAVAQQPAATNTGTGNSSA